MAPSVLQRVVSSEGVVTRSDGLAHSEFWLSHGLGNAHEFVATTILFEQPIDELKRFWANCRVERVQQGAKLDAQGQRVCSVRIIGKCGSDRLVDRLHVRG